MTVSEFFLGIVVSYVSTKIDSTLRKVSLTINPTKKYYEDMIKAFSKMPFIYKNIDSNVLEDYVKVEFSKGKGSTSNSNLNLQNYDLLKDYNKCLLLGMPGMGKSTFLRHVFLKVLQKDFEQDFLRGFVNEFPIFVSLKTVNNTSKSPILHHIVRQLSAYYKRDRVLKKLNELSKYKKLFLVLDGYDEIGFSESNNFIKEELEILLSAGNNAFTLKDNKFIDKNFLELYNNLVECRVWLSTRPNFYSTNRLDVIPNRLIDPHIKISGALDYVEMEILGLANIIELVEIIFSKYKGTPIFEKLSAEIFVEDIERSNDEELITFSKRPLFLVIMCYIYAKKVEEGKIDYKKIWVQNIDELIIECIEVLLKDLDKYKVQEEPKFFQAQYYRRRGEFFEEKFEFLKFISISSYQEPVAVFDTKFLNDKWKEYLETICKSEFRDQLLQELSRKKLYNPAQVQQIINSGVLIKSNLEHDFVQYDFPHRRFREILALKAAENPATQPFIFENLRDRNLNEFIQLLYEYNKDIRFRIIKGLLEEYTKEEAYVFDLVNVLLGKGSDEAIHFYLQQFLLDYLKQNKYVKFGSQFLNKTFVGDKFQDDISEVLLTSTRDNKVSSVKLCLEMMEAINAREFKLNVEKIVRNYKSESFHIGLIPISVYLIKFNRMQFDKLKKTKDTHSQYMIPKLTEYNPLWVIGICLNSMFGTANLKSYPGKIHKSNVLLFVHLYELFDTISLESAKGFLLKDISFYRKLIKRKTTRNLKYHNLTSDQFSLLLTHFKAISQISNEIESLYGS